MQESGDSVLRSQSHELGTFPCAAAETALSELGATFNFFRTLLTLSNRAETQQKEPYFNQQKSDFVLPSEKDHIKL